MLEYRGQMIITPGIREMQQQMRRIGIVGSVSCGLPLDADAVMEEYISLPLSMVGHDDVYALYANGDSMIEAGIDDGDMVLVRRQEEARNGEIVVAYVEGEGNTLKRLLLTKDGIFLHPENSSMADIPVEECRIQGVAEWVIKKLTA